NPNSIGSTASEVVSAPTYRYRVTFAESMENLGMMPRRASPRPPWRGSSEFERCVHDADHSPEVISSTGSCQVLTSEVSLSQPYQYIDASSTLHDQNVRSFSCSIQRLRRRRSTCSNTPLYDQA